MKKLIRMLSLCLTLAVMVSVLALPGSALAARSYAAIPVGANSNAQNRNAERAMTAISGYTLVDGAQFSFNHVVGERSEERGYEVARNGRGVKVLGGGSAQVAAAIFLAVKNMDGIIIDELSTYGKRYDGDYVESGDDAVVVDWQSGTDFAFTNNTGKTLTIYVWADDDEIRVSVDENEEVLGYGTTSISGDATLHNVMLAAEEIDGVQLGYGDVFSFNDLVGPRTKGNGYISALNGRGVKVTGGGVAQVASAVWLAVKDMEDIEVLSRHTYGKRYSGTYVESADDAIVTDYNAGTDFAFRYEGNDVITVRCFVQGETLICEVTTVEAVG